MTQFLDEKLNNHQTSTLSKAEQLHIHSTTNSDLLVSAIYPHSWMNNQRDFKTLPLLISYFNPSISLWFSFWLTSSSGQAFLEVLNCIEVLSAGPREQQTRRKFDLFQFKVKWCATLDRWEHTENIAQPKKVKRNLWYSLMTPVFYDKGGAGHVEIVLFFSWADF